MFTNRLSKRILIFIYTVAAFFLCCRSSGDQAVKSSPGVKVLQEIMAGNTRFSHDRPRHPDEGLQRVRDIAKEQHPAAVVISCSDSRVPPELIFDQGLGDLFVVRTAGNLVGSLEIGSVEYAVEHLHVPLVIVLAHQQCGAVKAFVEGGETPGHIKDIVDSIKAEQEISNIMPDDTRRLEHCIEANLRHSVHQLLNQSAIIREKVDQKELKIAAGIYDMENGLVKMENIMKEGKSQ